MIGVRGLIWITLAAICSPGALTAADPQSGFPYEFPDQEPDRPLSAAMQRNYTVYPAPRPENNELYTQFKYTQLEGFDYHGHDGTISRRDPSKVIFAKGQYYVWYTKRQTTTPPQGAQNCTDTIPSADWDLAEIWYAVSKDGFTWKEQGVAVPRPPKPAVGWRSVTTTDILAWKGKYYLYYQGFMEASGTRGDDCPVAVSWADSPDGPWTPYNKIVIPNGAAGEWDQYSIHDPYPLVHDGKIYLYYKSDANGKPHVRMHGLAIADDPLGPFQKHPLNPVCSSGHETTLFPFQKGVAAFVIRDGNEHNTIQYAEDWVNFEVKSIVELMPDAAGPFVPDAFTNTRDGRGITWGISHFTNYTGNWKQNHSILARFDCDLSRDVDDPGMKRHHVYFPADVYFRQGLSKAQRQHAMEATRKLQVEQTRAVDLKVSFGKVARSAVFVSKTDSIWGASPVKGDDGLYHLYYSRWPKQLGWAWVTDSEVAHATSKSPFGPWQFRDIALPRRGLEHWDGWCTHNPTVHKFGGKYYLYYMGNTGDGKVVGVPGKQRLNWTHRNNQRIGVAVADNPNGPWKRFDKPVLDVSSDPKAWDSLMTSNPSVCQRPDGGFLMIYKAVGQEYPLPGGGPVVHGVALADSPTGPFVKHDQPIFTHAGERFPAEDPYVWYQDGKYRAIVKRMKTEGKERIFTLAQYDSADGLHWAPAKHYEISDRKVTWEDGVVQQFAHLERPQLLIEEERPVALFCAGDTIDEQNVRHPFNIQIPIVVE